MRPGVTEEVWNEYFSPDRQMVWQFIFWALTFFGALVVQSTSYTLLNYILKFYVGINVFLLIAPQRRFSTYTLKMQKRLIRYSVLVFVVGIYAFGFVFLGSIILSGAIPLYNAAINQISTAHGLRNVLISIAVVMTVVSAFVRAYFDTFRTLRVGELLFVLPQKMFVRFIVYRKYRAKSHIHLMLIEIMIIYCCYAFSSIMASAVNDLVKIARI